MSGSSGQQLSATALEDLAGMPDPSTASPGDILTVASVGPLQAVWGAGAFVPLAGGTMTGTLENIQTPATDVAFQSKVTGDTDWRIQVTVGGKVLLGSGAAPPDTTIERTSGGRVTISSLLTVTSSINVGSNITMLGGGSAIEWFTGGAVGTEILRASLGGDAFFRYQVTRDGSHQWSDGTTSPSATLVLGRIAADTLAMKDPAGAALPGKIHHQYTTLTRTTGGTFSISDTTEQLFVDTAVAGATNPQLPAPVDGRTVVVKDVGANASADNITVTTVGGEDIENASSYVISADGESVWFRADGTEWWIVARYTP